jgi:hypothetical protein
VGKGGSVTGGSCNIPQQNVLDVVAFEHAADYCIWSSMVEKAAFSLSAFLTSSALT